MKLKTLFFTIFLTATSCLSFSQETYQCNNKYLHGNYVITPTISNLISLIHMPNSMFKKTMSKYNYELTNDGSAYISNTNSPSPYYTISKTTNTLSMIFTTDDGNFAETIRKQLREKTNSVQFDDDGYEVYKLKGQLDGIDFRYIFYLKEQNDGAVVLLKIL